MSSDLQRYRRSLDHPVWDSRRLTILLHVCFQISNVLFFVIPPVLMVLFRQYAKRVTYGVHLVWFMLIIVGRQFLIESFFAQYSFPVVSACPSSVTPITRPPPGTTTAGRDNRAFWSAVFLRYIRVYPYLFAILRYIRVNMHSVTVHCCFRSWISIFPCHVESRGTTNGRDGDPLGTHGRSCLVVSQKLHAPLLQTKQVGEQTT